MSGLARITAVQAPVPITGHKRAAAIGGWGWLIIAVATAYAVCALRWDWLLDWYPQLLRGLATTIALLATTTLLGLLLAVPIGFVQVVGPWWLSFPARCFCTVIRGTPLLLQLWLLYYGLGSLFPQFPGIRGSMLWPYLRQAWPYGVLALTLSYAAYEGEVFRGAFVGVDLGQLEAARSFGMSPWQVLHRIWFPQALHRALPTLAGETILQLKSTPLVATITVMDIYSVASQVRQQTYLTYEPLLVVCAVYILVSLVLLKSFALITNTRFMRSPS